MSAMINDAVKKELLPSLRAETKDYLVKKVSKHLDQTIDAYFDRLEKDITK